MHQASLKIALNLALWTLIFIVSTEAYNVSARYKRDEDDVSTSDDNDDDDDEMSPDILQVKYYHKGQVKSVFLREITDTTLASTFLQVRNIDEHGEVSDEYKIYDDSLNEPIFYHGVNSFSALSYFPRTRTLHGVLDQRFFVENLPLHDADKPDLVSSFITLMPSEFNRLDESICVRHEHRRNRMRRMTSKRKHEDSPDISPKKRLRVDNTKKKVYPEIFLIVDTSPIRIDTTLQNKFEKAIIYVLAYWNAVDMLFRNLKRIDVRINIAGILIGEKEHLVHSLMLNPVRTNGTRIFLPSENALEDLGSYFYNHDMIKRDSYDFLIWMTSGTLVTADNWYAENEDFYNSMRKKDYLAVAAPGDCGGMHYDEMRNHKRSNRAIVMYDDEYAQYHIAARGLAHLMLVPLDDVEISHGRHHSNCLSSNPMTESSGIMDLYNHKAEGYLLWSYCSEIHFESYARSPSSCCLFNYPSRTMGLLDYTNVLTIKSQCECYGLRRFRGTFYKHDICAKPLICSDEEGQKIKVGMPLDGSPCVPEGESSWSFCNHNDCI